MKYLRNLFSYQLSILACTTILTGCSSLPAFGPSSDSIVNAAFIEHTEAVAQAEFTLIDLAPSTLPQTIDTRPKRFSKFFVTQELLLSDEKIAAGDLISIRIWEGVDDGLFANNGQREITFTLTVSNSGYVEVPHAGRVKVENLSTAQIREDLLNRYQGKAVTPEISVQIDQTNSRGVSVLGAVAKPGRITIPAKGIFVLDLLALAGGAPNPVWETTLTITRNGRSETIALDWLMRDAHNNVVVLPGDIVNLNHTPRSFAVYGAVTKPGSPNIQVPEARLNDLLASAGGLNDMQAEARSVFIFRAVDAQDGAGVSYRLDMSRPDAFLLAQQFEIQNFDIVYVATADASEFRKFVTTLLSPFFGSVGSTRNLGN